MISLNLSAIKYQSILDDKNSPILKMNKSSTRSVDGKIWYEVYGWLKPELKASRIESSAVYGNCDATGGDTYLHIATWKCISEIMERWAFHYLLITESKAFGMNIDPSTTGFAALPAWPKSTVRKIAFGEAIERWSVSNWWRGNLNSRLLKRQESANSHFALEILIEDSPGAVVIVYKKIKNYDDKIDSQFYCYGFSYGRNAYQAEQKAVTEMNRNKKALSLMKKNEPKNISDSRLIYFSTENGFSDFSDRVEARVNLPVKLPGPIIDEEIYGDWTRYSTVWRCLLPDTDYCWHDKKHFMF